MRWLALHVCKPWSSQRAGPTGAPARPLRCPRCQVEGTAVDEESLAYLGEIGEETSLRHAVQLMTPAMVLAKTSGR